MVIYQTEGLEEHKEPLKALDRATDFITQPMQEICWGRGRTEDAEGVGDEHRRRALGQLCGTETECHPLRAVQTWLN